MKGVCVWNYCREKDLKLNKIYEIIAENNLTYVIALEKKSIVCVKERFKVIGD